ncbi:MAG: type IV toxin-antitoxin system AbiEi family antitoxin domain-containing protein [Thermoleophilia bacterium]
MARQLANPRPDAVVADIAARRHGVLSRRQLVDAGLSPAAIAHRVRSGRLHRLHRGVFAVGHRPTTRRGWWIAAVLAYGDRAALSHMAALSHWDLRPSSASTIDVSVATRNGLAAREGIRVHRCGRLEPGEITIHDGIPVTTVARTLLDGAAMLRAAGLARAVERCEILRLFDLTLVEQAIGRHPYHPGAASLASALELYRDHEPTRSELEAMLLALSDRHGLPRPLVNRAVEGCEVDFLWPGHRLIVETDGRGTHLTRAAFERDRARDAMLTVAGYRVVRFTHRQILDEPRSVARTLRALLATPAPAAA